MALKSAPHFRRRRHALTRALVISTTALFLVTTPVAVSMAQPADSPENSAPSQIDSCDPVTSTATTTTTATTTPTSTTAPTATSVPCAPADDDKPAPSATTTSVQKTPAATTAPTTTTSAPSSESAPTSSAPQQKAPAGEWKPTENPQSTIVPGQMRSDREEVPAPFTKEDADRAEVAEARLRTSRNATACQIYWPSWFNVCGEIKAKYDSLGGPGSFLSYPSSGNLINPGNTGERVTFLNGPIYWSNASGAHPVVNSILNRWGVHGYEAGWLGYPTTDEIVHADGVGRRQEFQNGAVYVAFSNAIGSAIKNGPIRDKWNSVGAETPGSLLGYLTGDEIPLPDGQGRMARFERGVIYWSPNTGAHPVTGNILQDWTQLGYEQGIYGYPTADVETQTGGVSQNFQGGVITNGKFTPVAGGGNLYDCYVINQGVQENSALTWITASGHITCSDLKQMVKLTVVIIHTPAGTNNQQFKIARQEFQQGMPGILINVDDTERKYRVPCTDGFYRSRIDVEVMNEDGGTMKRSEGTTTLNMGTGGCQSLPFTCPSSMSAYDCDGATRTYLKAVGAAAYGSGWVGTTGYPGGTVYKNLTGLLPSPLGTYHEYDIHPPQPDGNRGLRRIVIDSGYPGNSYFTDDHYVSFIAFTPP